MTTKTPYLPEVIPSNTYKQTEPLKATVLENTKLTAEDSANDVRHVVFSLEGSNYVFLDGQSAGILAPGTDKDGKPHKLRLYSIASAGFGEDGQGKHMALCVKRAIFEDSETGETKEGVCSSYICNLKVGDVVNITGPVGKAFLLPDVENANLIMLATGTGIAPFRGFLKTRYTLRKEEQGKAWLFFGAQTRKDFLYEQELESYQQQFADSFKLTTAFSREEQNAEGQRMYIQHRVAENANELLALLQKPETYLYICGLKGMEHGILESLEKAADAQGISWGQLFEQLKAEKRWRVEVY